MKLAISFSGGRTSAYMTKMLLDTVANLYSEVVVTFANTGQEHEATLDFVHQCDLHFGFKTVWIEAVVQKEKRKSTLARVVTYETADRNGKPFEEVISKYGIPNTSWPHCTRELKTTPMTKYLRSIGWKKGDYVYAIGIRADETRRVDKKACAHNIIYPLVEAGIDKQDVLSWWKEQAFDLQIPEHLGNCTWCWKKSFNKHMHVIHDMPSAFNFPQRMECLYPFVGADFPVVPRKFFRQFMSVTDLKSAYKELAGKLPRITESGGCSESCEVFPTKEK